MSTTNGAGRERLDRDRKGHTVKLVVGGIDVYVTANCYPDGRLAEVFIKGAGQQGSTLNGMIDDLATMLSIALQSGADLGTLCLKLHRSAYDPSGPVNHPEIGRANSLPDAVACWLALRFGNESLRREMGVGEYTETR